ncbi:hypothetical protein [Methylocapsa acidiphila]|uniref:hypothetical protein n=1 Tax=Methylocapsa acidiphila TaxID=133552 RepID=UPI0004245A54|nr:hypothetical protein [Methylocapsa acidiphila]
MILDIFREFSKRLPGERLEQFIPVATAFCIFLWCAACAAKACFSVQRKGAQAHGVLAIAHSGQDGGGAAICEELAGEAAKKGVTAASLQGLHAYLREAGVSDADIPGRMQGALDRMAELRARLAASDAFSQGESNVQAEALACFDRGDLASARQLLFHAADDAVGAGARAERYVAAASIDHLLLDYRAAAEAYCAAEASLETALADGADPLKKWRLRMEQGRALLAAASADADWRNFVEAIDAYRGALDLVARAAAPLDWAECQYCLGEACLAFGLSEKDPDRVEEAIDAYLAALEEWTRERAPFDWAKTQNSLGDALLALGEDEGEGDRLRPAVEAYRAALQEWTRETAPMLWAMTQANLGDALEALGARTDGQEALRQAVEAYEAAVNGGAGDLDPSSAAATNAALGDALLAMSAREETPGALERSAEAYRTALALQGPDAPPLERAKIQVNLAYVLGSLSSRSRNRSLLGEALALVDVAVAAIKGGGAKKDIQAAENAQKTLREALART